MKTTFWTALGAVILLTCVSFVRATHLSIRKPSLTNHLVVGSVTPLSSHQMNVDEGSLQLRFMDSRTGICLVPTTVILTQVGGAGYRIALPSTDLPLNHTMNIPLPRGIYEIAIRANGYKEMLTSLSIGQQLVNVNFHLDPDQDPYSLSSDFIETFHRPDALVATGTVVDDVTGLPLHGVDIRILDNTGSTQSDEKGHFQLAIPLPDKHVSTRNRNSLSFEKSGFTTEVRENFDMWPNGDMILIIRMLHGGGTNVERIIQKRDAVVITR